MKNSFMTECTAAQEFVRLENEVHALLEMTGDGLAVLSKTADREEWAHSQTLETVKHHLVTALAELSGESHDDIIEALEIACEEQKKKG
jgi:hypothetical protein